MMHTRTKASNFMPRMYTIFICRLCLNKAKKIVDEHDGLLEEILHTSRASLCTPAVVDIMFPPTFQRPRRRGQRLLSAPI